MMPAPSNDLNELERHRAEARRYLPAIQDGTDPYTGRWFGRALWFIGGCAVLVWAAQLINEHFS